MTEFRYDAVPLQARIDSDTGFLTDTPILTRTGVFSYRKPDGTIRREYRPPSAVFHADHLMSLRGKPITEGHPGLVTAKIARKHAVGAVLSEGRQDGDNLIADIVIHDTAPITDRGLKELSLGYKVELDETPGEINGERFDATQISLVANHLALVKAGRAGNARLNLDAADFEDATPAESTSFTKGLPSMSDQLVDVRLDESGLIYKAAPEIQVAIRKMHAELEKMRGDSRDAAAELKAASVRADEAIAVAGKRADEAIAAANLRADEAVKARDAAQGEAEALKAQHDKIRADARDAAIARLSIETQAKDIGVSFNSDASDNDIRVAVLAKVSPAIRLDGKSDEYVRAAYDIAMAGHAERKSNAGTQRAAAAADPTRMDEAFKSSAAAAKARMLKGA